jgi:hypothetical protein
LALLIPYIFHDRNTVSKDNMISTKLMMS